VNKTGDLFLLGKESGVSGQMELLGVLELEEGVGRMLAALGRGVAVRVLVLYRV
jgi:hypothetical protein